MQQYILGDAFKLFPKNLEPSSIDLFLTSAPDMHELGHNDVDKYKTWLSAAVDLLCKFVSNDGFIVMTQTDRKRDGFIIPKHVDLMLKLFDHKMNLKDYKIVIKNDMNNASLYRLNYSHLMVFTRYARFNSNLITSEYRRGLWQFKWPKNPNFFPEELARLVISSLCRKGGLVADPFAGRGTVALEALWLKRNFFCTEIDSTIYDKNYVYSNDIF